MAANVIALLELYSIEFVDSGPNVAKGNVNIQCPWCGESDPSHHLGINLETAMWGCWRNKNHRGRLFYKLLAKLTALSFAEARRLTGEGGARAIQQGEMERAVQALTEAPNTPKSNTFKRKLQLPSEFRKLSGFTPQFSLSAKNFIRYMVKERGFPKHHLKNICREYELRFAIGGRFKNRIIFPVYEDKRLLTYVGRYIYPSSALRYLALDKEESVKQVKDCLYNYDKAMEGGNELFIVEGPFDVLKMDFYSRKKYCRAIGLFNMNLEPAQIDLLFNLRGKFDQYTVLLDAGQVAESLRLQTELSFLKSVEVFYMRGDLDPGDLTPKQARDFSRHL